MKNLTETYAEYKERVKKEKKKKRKKESNEDLNYFLQILSIFLLFAVLVILVLLVINPAKNAAEIRNNKRRSDLSQILNEVSVYSRNQLQIPDEIPIANNCNKKGNEICKLTSKDCEDMVDLSFLRDSEIPNLLELPEDPLYLSISGTGYYIAQDGEGGITVCAPHAERRQDISFTKYLY